MIGRLMLMMVGVLLCASTAHAQSERYYQDKWCAEHGGQVEFVLPDRTRVDCLTETHAIEFDFARKWAESIGQSLYYATRTGKDAGIVLILRLEGDLRHLDRLTATIIDHALPINLWLVIDDKEDIGPVNRMPLERRLKWVM